MDNEFVERVRDVVLRGYVSELMKAVPKTLTPACWQSCEMSWLPLSRIGCCLFNTYMRRWRCQLHNHRKENNDVHPI